MEDKERIEMIRNKIRKLQEIGVKPSVYATYLNIPLKKIYNFMGGKVNFSKDLDTLDELERLIEELEDIFFDNKND